MKLAIPALALVLILSGCWAISDIRENRELDRALPFQAPVYCGEISALTPQAYLLSENRGDEMVLRLAASPRRYTAKAASKEQFDGYLESAKREGKRVEFCSAAEGLAFDVHLIQWEAGGKVWGEYVTYVPVEGGRKGIIATYLEWGFPWQPSEETRWTEVPRFFVRFVGSLKLGNGPNQSSQPTRADGPRG